MINAASDLNYLEFEANGWIAHFSRNLERLYCRSRFSTNMAYRSFSHFIEELERMSELLRIAEPVATELEITEMANRQMKAPGGGKALLFERPTINGKISPFPLAINTMGSERRMARALGLESIDEIAHQMQLILKAKPPTSMRRRLVIAETRD